MTSIETHFARRYGGEPVSRTDLPSNEVLASLLTHRSVRDYTSEPVSDAVLAVLVAAAQSAATSSNLQLWSVISVRDLARKAALSEVGGGQRHIAQCPLFLAWIADHHRIASIARDQGVVPQALDQLEMLVMAIVDASLAAQNAVVAAESLGLGTVYIGGLRNDPRRVAEILELPAQAFAVFGLCVGWPTTPITAEVKPRLPQSAVLHPETYAAHAVTPAELQQYDRLMARFYAQNGMSTNGGWTGHSAGRIGPGALRRREFLGAHLKGLGFPHR